MAFPVSQQHHLYGARRVARHGEGQGTQLFAIAGIIHPDEGRLALDPDAVVDGGESGCVPFYKKTFWLKVLVYGQSGSKRNRRAPIGKLKANHIQQACICMFYVKMFLADVLGELVKEERSAVSRPLGHDRHGTKCQENK